MNIFVANLNYKIQDDQLKQFFLEYGEVSSAKVIMDKITGKSKGYGFVEMTDDVAAQKAIEDLDGVEVEGKAITVKQARPRTEGSGNRGGGFQRKNNSRFNNRYE